MNIDWSEAPEGATHYDSDPNGFAWLRPNHSGRGWEFWGGKGNSWICCGSVSGVERFVPRPSRSIGENLPPIESTVRIVPGNTTIWDVAEQFVGVDCRLKAVFMLEETQMVAVEGIESGQCCCFWASMVRTPEQAKAEEREAKAKAMYLSIFFAESDGAWHRMPEANRQTFRKAIDAGWQQVKP